MKNYQLFLLSLLSGILLWLSWNPNGFSFMIFFAFVPLFFISDFLLQKESRVPLWKGIIYSYPAFLLWNVATTWWIWNSTPPGSIAAFVLNALFMSMVFGLWHWTRKQNMPIIAQPIALIAFWMSWEYLHLHWDLTWPWLNIGNVFSPCTRYVQWYEFTGTFGGTLWVFGANFFLYYIVKTIKSGKKVIWYKMALFFGWVLIPLVISVFMYRSHKDHMKEINPVEAVIVQQNTDPWEEQYSLTNVDHTVRILQLAVPAITEKTQLLVCSESAIPHTISAAALLQKNYPVETYNYYGFALLDSLVDQYPRLNIIAGLSTFDMYDHKATETAKDRGDGYFMDMHNTSICYNKNGCTELYYKSRLVPGVEKMPFPKVFGFLENLVIDLGGPSGSLGVDTTQRAFHTTILNGTCKVGAPICYESVYGELFAGFVKDGAQLMTVITNDAWWGNTPGYKQHFLFSKLRAIETRRTILRAANTGISGVIDECGDVVQKSHYNERTVIKQTVY
ncbi:MAG: apolipoprotein N-acyltransferase, partial [Bacteroidales bacterium]